MRIGLTFVALVGVALGVWLILHFGLEQVGEAFLSAGWQGVLAITAVYFVSLVSVRARVADAADERGSECLARSLWVRWLRDGTANLLAVVPAAGEIVAVRELTLHDVPLGMAAAMTVVDLTMELASQLLFTLLGVTISDRGAAQRGHWLVASRRSGNLALRASEASSLRSTWVSFAFSRRCPIGWAGPQSGQLVRDWGDTRWNTGNLPASSASSGQLRPPPCRLDCRRRRGLDCFVVHGQSCELRRRSRHREHGLRPAHRGLHRALGGRGAGGRIYPCRRSFWLAAAARSRPVTIETRARNRHRRAGSHHLAVFGAVAAVEKSRSLALSALIKATEALQCRPSSPTLRTG